MSMDYTKEDAAHDRKIVDEAIAILQSETPVKEKRAKLMALRERAKAVIVLAGAFEALELQEHMAASKTKK
jgi:hypothetical protein